MPGQNNKVAEDGRESGTDKAPVIVAIGASAGGIPALQNFFRGIPQNTGAAFIVVLHLDPQHHSELSAIVATRTKMPVVQVDKTARLESNHVYVIPPDRRLQVNPRRNPLIVCSMANNATNTPHIGIAAYSEAIGVSDVTVAERPARQVTSPNADHKVV